MTTETSPLPLFLVINGPNLNLLGTREPERYGHETLLDLEALVSAAAERLNVRVEFVQSNHEGALIDVIHAARGAAAGIILNAGAYTHTSIAIRDAIAAVSVPTVEVHVTNVHAREDFRHHSYLAGVADAVIAGAGLPGYVFALEHLAAKYA